MTWWRAEILDFLEARWLEDHESGNLPTRTYEANRLLVESMREWNSIEEDRVDIKVAVTRGTNDRVAQYLAIPYRDHPDFRKQYDPNYNPLTDPSSVVLARFEVPDDAE